MDVSIGEPKEDDFIIDDIVKNEPFSLYKKLFSHGGYENIVVKSSKSRSFLEIMFKLKTSS